MWKSVGSLARLKGVSRQTILRWIRQGVFEKVERTVGGHYRVWVEREPVTFLYARVSSAKQASSIETQKAILQKAYRHGTFISDVASGFNFERRGFRTILERCLNGTPCIVVATTSDRITRTGFGLIKRIIELSGGEVRLLEEREETENFDTTALIGFITSFIASHHGKRAAKRRGDSDEEDPDLPVERASDDDAAARLPTGVQPGG